MQNARAPPPVLTHQSNPPKAPPQFTTHNPPKRLSPFARSQGKCEVRKSKGEMHCMIYSVRGRNERSGSQLSILNSQPTKTSISACAESPCTSKACSCRASVYLRLRGVTAPTGAPPEMSSGLSPLARSHRPERRQSIKWRRSISACAESPERTARTAVPRRVYLRLRGVTGLST